MLQFENEEYEEKKFNLCWWYLCVTELILFIQFAFYAITGFWADNIVRVVIHFSQFAGVTYNCKKQSKRVMMFNIFVQHVQLYFYSILDFGKLDNAFSNERS